MFQSEFSEVGFLFMHFSQAFEDRHFRKVEMFLPMLGGVVRLLLDANQVRLRTRRGRALSQRFETRIVA
jgi:hypothetical protein